VAAIASVWPLAISVGQVITAVDESVDATKCLGKGAATVVPSA
jgi:DNA-binding IscR family transcriptional regulator